MTGTKKYPKVTDIRSWFGGVPCFVKFDSTSAAEALYDHVSHDLIITYTNGVRYVYNKVPIDLWINLLRSESIGTFIASRIKGKYEYERLTHKDTSG